MVTSLQTAVLIVSNENKSIIIVAIYKRIIYKESFHEPYVNVDKGLEIHGGNGFIT